MNDQIEERIKQRLDEAIEVIKSHNGKSASILTGKDDAENRKLLAIAIYQMSETFRVQPADFLLDDLRKLVVDLEVYLIGQEAEGRN